MSHTENEFAAALDAGAALADIKNVEGVPVAVLPHHYTVHELEHLLPAPARNRGSVELFDAESFTRFVNEQKTDATRLYFSIRPYPGFVAVFNDRKAGQPAWCDFRAVYNAPLSQEWKNWTGMDGKPMKQEEFALFIERNLLDIHSPEPAALLELAQTFQAKKSVNFASGTRLTNGQVQFVFEETIQARAGEKGQITVPEQIEIVIPVFDGSKVGDRLTAKFRYRITDAKLAMWYELERPHKVLETAIGDLRKQIEADTTLTAFNGSI